MNVKIRLTHNTWGCCVDRSVIPARTYLPWWWWYYQPTLCLLPTLLHCKWRWRPQYKLLLIPSLAQEPVVTAIYWWVESKNQNITTPTTCLWTYRMLIIHGILILSLCISPSRCHDIDGLIFLHNLIDGFSKFDKLDFSWIWCLTYIDSQSNFIPFWIMCTNGRTSNRKAQYCS